MRISAIVSVLMLCAIALTLAQSAESTTVKMDKGGIVVDQKALERSAWGVVGADSADSYRFTYNGSNDEGAKVVVEKAYGVVYVNVNGSAKSAVQELQWLRKTGAIVGLGDLDIAQIESVAGSADYIYYDTAGGTWKAYALGTQSGGSYGAAQQTAAGTTATGSSEAGSAPQQGSTAPQTQGTGQPAGGQGAGTASAGQQGGAVSEPVIAMPDASQKAETQQAGQQDVFPQFPQEQMVAGDSPPSPPSDEFVIANSKSEVKASAEDECVGGQGGTECAATAGGFDWKVFIAPLLTIVAVAMIAIVAIIMRPASIEQAELHRVLSSPTRLDILNELSQNEKIPTDLSTRLGKSKATIIEHLDKLCETGFVEKVETQGRKFVYYRITGKGKTALLRHAA